MKSLQKTGPASTDAHYHVAFIDSDHEVALLGVNEAHTHPAQWIPEVQAQPEVPPQTDPATGALISPGTPATPGVPAHWEIQPGADGHTHEGFEDVELKNTSKKGEEDKDIVEEVIRDYAVAVEIEHGSKETADEADKFYCGEQWEKTDEAELDSQQRAHLTINKIERNIDQLSGYQREQRTDIKFTPQEDGDSKVADILNIISKMDFERCFFSREESKAFEDTSITGRGLFNCFMDFSEDLRGVFKVEQFPWTDITLGEHNKEDLSDCEVLFKSKMFSKTKAKQLWPDSADDIDTVFQTLDGVDGLTKVQENGKDYDLTGKGVTIPTTIGGASYVDTIRKELRVLERWKRVYTPVSIAAFPQEDFYFPMWNWQKPDIAQLKTIQGFLVLSKNIQKIRITKVCGDVLLSDENPADVPGDDFHIVPVYAKKRRGMFWGKVKPLIDPQREINHRHSQCVDIGNKMCSYGYFIDASTFADEKEKYKFKDSSTSPGFVSEVASLDRKPVKEEGAKFPSEIVQLLQLENTEISELANIISEPAGANESGFAYMQRSKQRLTGNQYLFDNLSFAKKKIGKLYIRAVQKFYPAERILRMIRSNKVGAGQQGESIGGTPLEDWKDDDILTLLKDADLSLYDVAVDESPYSPTARASTFVLMTELQKSGGQVPPDVLIKGADLPDKTRQEILDSYAAQAQQTAAAQQNTTNMEISKTLAAKGIYTPQVKQILGYDPNAVGAQNGAPPPQPDIQGDGGITAG